LTKYTLDEVIEALRQQITDNVDGIQAAPDHPPESIHEFPFLLLLATDLNVDTYPGRCEFHFTVSVQLHVARTDMPSAIERANGFAISIPKAIWSDPTLDGVAMNIGQGQALRGRLEHVAWGNGAISTTAWVFDIPVKYEEAFD